MSSCATVGWIAGTTWIALQPVPRTATLLPARSTSWRPRAVWEGGGLEPLETRNRGDLRDGQLTAGRDQDVGLVRAAARLKHPLAAPVVPACARHLGARADLLEHAVPLRDLLEVALDLGLGRIAARPPRVWLEGELVEVGW